MYTFWAYANSGGADRASPPVHAVPGRGPSFKRTADRIIVLREGVILKQGDHAGLPHRGGHYAELCNTYFRHQVLEDIDQAHRVYTPPRYCFTPPAPGLEIGATSMDAYEKLARHLDALPNGFPPTQSGVERRLLAKIFTPEEAELAAQMRLTLESPAQVAERIGGDPHEMRKRLKDMAVKGLINVERGEGGLVFGALPFVVGVYENQIGSFNLELAQLFEEYYKEAYGRELALQPQVHRVIPVEESVGAGMEIRPYESAVGLISHAKSWGVLDCICRKQKALLGEPCSHPIDVCMAFSQTPYFFDKNPVIHAQTQDESLATLRRAAEAGLVHSVTNSQQGVTYICNCCTCACGILRGLADLGIADVVARSAFVATVTEEDCVGCDLCRDRCQFNALTVDDMARIDSQRCVGCGVCAVACPEGALVLVRREPGEAIEPPLDISEWRRQRARATGRDLETVL